MERPLEELDEAAAVLGETITAAQYEQLPENSRLELVDGVLRPMTPPTTRHQLVYLNLLVALRTVCPGELRILPEQEIRLGELHRRNPDVVVVPQSAVNLDGYSYAPSDVVIAVEIVSPGTATTDRLHKPAEYAMAGVAHYWRIETQPAVTVYTYQLGENGQYFQSGRFGPGDTTAIPGLPWAKISIDDLAP